MRNLDECKAEIFRLGDKKIKQRKKKRMRAFSVCVPLCLCLVAFSVTVLPKMLTAEDKNTNQPPTEIEQTSIENTSEIVGSTDSQYKEVVINGVGGLSFYYKTNDIYRVNDIADLIDSFYYLNDGGESRPNFEASVPQPPTSSGGENEDPELNSSVSGYSILLITDKGEKVEYILTENALENKNTGEKINLKDEQVISLLSKFMGGD